MFPVLGHLNDPAQPGSVDNWMALCEDTDVHVMTTVVPATTTVEETPMPDRETIQLAISPNPFADRTTFSYTMPRSGRVELRVCDISGRAVAAPVSETQSAGRHTVEWAGLSSDGDLVASGVYFLQMRAEGFDAIKRLAVLE